MTTKTTADHGKVAAEILAGRYDGHLINITQAITARLRESTVRMCWRLRLDGDEWTEQTVTAGELAYCERLLSTDRRTVSYLQLDPMSSIDHRTALVIAHLHKTRGVTAPDAIARAEAITSAEQEALFDLYEVTDHPKDDPETSPSS